MGKTDTERVDGIDREGERQRARQVERQRARQVESQRHTDRWRGREREAEG